MDTKVKSNGTAKNGADIKINNNGHAGETVNPQFVANNPVNKESVKPEPAKEEPKAEPVSTARNLEQTIKYLEELHNLKTTRDRYLKTIGNLDSFEIDLKKETDDADGNYYQGCSLTIEDDKSKKFSTKNPLIIWTVAQEVTHICEGKLAEVEAKLVIK